MENVQDKIDEMIADMNLMRSIDSTRAHIGFVDLTGNRKAEITVSLSIDEDDWVGE